MKPKKKVKKKVKYGLICIFILLLILIWVLFYFPKKDVKEMPKTTTKNEKATYVNPLPEFRKLYQNDDIVAQIEIPSLDLKELNVFFPLDRISTNFFLILSYILSTVFGVNFVIPFLRAPNPLTTFDIVF